MRHDLNIDGIAFRLRPITDDDAAFVVGLRGERERNRHLHVVSAQVEDQLEWQAAYYRRPGDYYFVVAGTSDGRREGLISLYDVDQDRRRGEWGRWILKPGSVAAVESAWLIYRVGFDLLGLQEMYCRTIAENASVVSFHDSCGLRRRALLPAHFEIAERRLDAVEHGIDHADWPQLEKRLGSLARIRARRSHHG